MEYSVKDEVCMLWRRYDIRWRN